MFQIEEFAEGHNLRVAVLVRVRVSSRNGGNASLSAKAIRCEQSAFRGKQIHNIVVAVDREPNSVVMSLSKLRELRRTGHGISRFSRTQSRYFGASVDFDPALAS